MVVKMEEAKNMCDIGWGRPEGTGTLGHLARSYCLLRGDGGRICRVRGASQESLFNGETGSVIENLLKGFGTRFG